LTSNVLNTSIDTPESLNFGFPKLTKEQERVIIAGLFEQLLIFDQVTITANRLNFALTFLINGLGINTVERLLKAGYIKLMVWTPVIVTGSGRQLDNGTIDESVIYGQPPIVGGALSAKDFDPEKHIHASLKLFNLHKDRQRIFTRLAVKNYVVPNGLAFSTDSAKLVIESYENNNLQALGLPYTKEPDQLDKKERMLLLNLGHKVIETAMLSQYNLKSYENYDHYEICKQNFSNIGNAFNISDNTTRLFKIENLPNLKELYLNDNLDFDSVFKIRHLSTAKYFRKWINQVGENANSQEVTAEYLNQIKGNTKFFESTRGKFVKNLGLFGVSTGVGEVIGGQIGAAAGIAMGKVIEPAVDYGLGLLETFWLDNLLKGKNPSMFIDDIKKEIKE
jgi:hypothetical protein